jgi:hypothetical protein
MPESLQTLFGQSQEELDAGPELATLLKTYLKSREQKEFIAAQMKEATKVVDDLELQILQRMELEKLKSVKACGAGFTSCVKSYFALPPKDQVDERARCLTWLRRYGASELVEESIHQGTLTKFLRERKEEGKTILAAFKETEMKYLSVRKS